MKKLFAALRRAPKRTSALVAMIAAAVVVPAALFAWGPSDRATFTMERPASYVTFNSITNNPTQGDERNFVQIKDVTAGGRFVENVDLVPGHEYQVYSFYHNNASSSLNDAEDNYKGIAKDAKMRIQMPATVKNGQSAQISGIVSASNANPTQVWDEASAKANSGDVVLRYVQNSATIHSNGAVNGQKLPDTLLTTGASLGYDSLNGNLPGCNEFAGYVTFNFKAGQPNFEVTKQVATKGSNAYAESVTAKPGDEVQYKIQYKNTGSTQQDNVVIRDELPAGVTYVAGTTQMASSASGGQYAAVSDNVTKDGINIGSYTANGGNAFVKFTAKVVDNDKLEKCGVNTLINKAYAQTPNGTKSDTANVVVSKDCTPPPATPVYTCDALTASKISETQYKFTGKATAKDGATIVSYTFNFGDGTTQTVTNPTDVAHTYAKSGTYNATLSVTVKVNGELKTVTSNKCKTEVCVKIPVVVTIKVCELTTKKVITINEKDFDAKKHSKNLDDCKEKPPVTIKVCDLTTKKIVTINESDFDSSKHSKNLADCETKPPVKIVVCDITTNKIVTINESDFDSAKHSKNLDDCKAKPGEITVCELATKKIVTITEDTFDDSKHSKNLDDCAVTPVTPETPAELPHTGASENMLTMLGAGSLIAAIGYYAASRKALG